MDDLIPACFQHFGNEDSSIQYFQYFGDQKQFDDESDSDEKVVRRKEYHNQYFTNEIQRVPNKFGSKIGAIYPSKSYGGERNLFILVRVMEVKGIYLCRARKDQGHLHHIKTNLMMR